jgi:hypothetical protein
MFTNNSQWALKGFVVRNKHSLTLRQIVQGHCEKLQFKMFKNNLRFNALDVLKIFCHTFLTYYRCVSLYNLICIISEFAFGIFARVMGNAYVVKVLNTRCWAISEDVSYHQYAKIAWNTACVLCGKPRGSIVVCRE